MYRGFLVTSNSTVTTTTTQGSRRATTPPMPRWSWPWGYHSARSGACTRFPADAALGLAEGYTPALAKLMCLEGADETT